MPDAIDMTAQLAFKQYEAGEITKEVLIEILQKCINARAQTNGYADQFGAPFPEHELGARNRAGFERHEAKQKIAALVAQLEKETK